MGLGCWFLGFLPIQGSLFPAGKRVLPDPGDGILFPVCGLGERGGEWGTDPSWPQSHYQSPAPSHTSHLPCSIPLSSLKLLGGCYRDALEPRLPNLASMPLPAGWALHIHLLDSPSLRPECEWGGHGPRTCYSHLAPTPFLMLAPCASCLKPMSPPNYLLLQALADLSLCNLCGLSRRSVAESTVLGTE